MNAQQWRLSNAIFFISKLIKTTDRESSQSALPDKCGQILTAKEIALFRDRPTALPCLG
jgi:hypothetical protein